VCLGLACAAAVVTAQGGGVARGSCGDWLAGHPAGVVPAAAHGRAEPTRLETPAAAPQALPLTSRPAAAPTPGRIPPCDGPACRRAPLLPPLSPGPPAEVLPADVALPVTAGTVALPVRSPRFAAGSDLRPSSVAASVPTPPPRPAFSCA